MLGAFVLGCSHSVGHIFHVIIYVCICMYTYVKRQVHEIIYACFYVHTSYTQTYSVEPKTDHFRASQRRVLLGPRETWLRSLVPLASPTSGAERIAQAHKDFIVGSSL